MANSDSDILVEKLGALLKSKADLIVPMKNKIWTLQEELGFLRMFFRYTAKWITKDKKLEEHLERIKGLTLSSTMWKFYLHVLNMDESMAGEMAVALSDMMQTIEPIKREVREYVKVSKSSETISPMSVAAVLGFVNFNLENLKKLLDFKGGSIASVKDHIESLREVHNSWRYCFSKMFMQCDGHEKDLLKRVASVANEVGCAVFLLHADKTEEHKAREMNPMILDLLNKVEVINEEVSKCTRIPQFSINTNEVVVRFVDILLKYLMEILDCNADLTDHMNDLIKTVQDELKILKILVIGNQKQHIEFNNLDDLTTRVGDLSYEMEVIINSFIVRDDPVWYPTLSDAIEEIKLIKEDMLEFYDKSFYEKALLDSTKKEPMLCRPTKVEEVVGFEVAEETICEQLARGTQRLDVISIIGMAGIGKTTLANQVFYSPYIAYHFDIRAWCSVSQKYQKRELLLSILKSFMEFTDQNLEMSGENLEVKLYKSLKGRRYLIVIDDMWDIDSWNDLRRSLPDDNNGSRIIITSRHRDVASKVPHGSPPLLLNFLSDDQSWELFQRKVFQGKTFPPKLLSLGRKIAENCQGLPLSVVEAALLAKKDMTTYWWEQVAETVGGSKQLVDTFELSYNNLPNHLKHCFLYCGAFGVDEEIPVRKLIFLWIAEGFIKKTKQKNVEDVAEEYLRELIDRSLLLVARKRFGEVKACHIHYQFQDLCLRKMNEENFFQLFHGPVTTSEQSRRLCVLSEPSRFFRSRKSFLNIRSLLCSATESKLQPGDFDLSVIFHSFKLLRVLDLGYIKVGNTFLRGIEILVHLKYLALQGDISSIPSSITNLWKLETLIVKGLSGEIELPATILNMVKLRHLLIKDYAAFSSSCYTRALSDRPFQLLDVQTLSTPALSYENVEIMRQFPNVRKLRCIFLESWPPSEECFLFPMLDFLTQLESLKVFYYGSVRFPCVPSFPVQLKKLTMSNFCLPWEDLSKIARLLPNLEVLKLLCEAFEGKQWETNEGDFLELKILKLERLNFVQWNVADSSHFPRLEQLVLLECKQLEHIPFSFADIPTLQVIEVNCCSHSAAISARTIQEDQQDMGNDELEVLIYPSELAR